MNAKRTIAALMIGPIFWVQIGLPQELHAGRDRRDSLDADGHALHQRYDIRGLLVECEDAEGGLTRYEHNALGQLVARRQIVNRGGLGTLVTLYAPDENGNPLFITDPRGKIYAFTYDDAGRKSSMTTPLGFSESWTFTEFGELATHTDANGKVASHEYDILGRPVLETHTRAGAVLARITRAYDGASNLTAIERTGGGASFRIETDFDTRNLPTETRWFVSGSLFRKLTFGHDAAGNRSSLGGPDGERFVYTHDGNNQLATIERNGTTFAKMKYDSGGRPVATELSNGVTISRAYTRRGELREIVSAGRRDTLASYAYTYTPAGNRETATLGHLGVSGRFEYLPTVHWLARETWGASPAPSPQGSGAGASPAPSPEGSGAGGAVSYSGEYTFDPAGNRARAVRNGATSTYTIDDDNRLTHEDRELIVGPGTPAQIFGTPIVDSTAPGRSASVINDGVTTDNPSATFAWMNQETPTQHFAGLAFGVEKMTDEIRLFIPTLRPAPSPKGSGAGMGEELPAQANSRAQPPRPVPSPQGSGTGPGSASSGIRRFKFQMLVGETWLDIPLSSIAGATPVPGGWFATTEPTAHEIVATYLALPMRGIRVLMDAGGGPASHPNRLLVNEIQSFHTPAATVRSRGIDYGYDNQGNMTSRDVFDGSTLESHESFGHDYMNRIESYLRQESGTTRAFQTYAYVPTGQRINTVDNLTGRAEWFMSDGEDVISDYVAAAGTFSLQANYVQSLSIDSKLARIDASGTATFYLPVGAQRACDAVFCAISRAGITVGSPLAAIMVWFLDQVQAEDGGSSLSGKSVSATMAAA